LGAGSDPAGLPAGKVEDHSFLVAVEVFLALETIAPDFHRQRLSGNLAEAQFSKKTGSDGQSEDGLKT
jgi:hypothetical protein